MIEDINFFLREDLGRDGDITSDALFSDEKGNAHIIAKQSCVVAGVDEAALVFQKTGAMFSPKIKDGERVESGYIVAEISGSFRSIFKGERLALNILGRMSGIATLTRDLVQMCKQINPDVDIYATRKTTPGFRRFEKKAVMLGGGKPHRMGLFDEILIKDNHIKAVGSLHDAVVCAKQQSTHKLIEVEVETEQEAVLVAELGVDVIMLDNFSPQQVKKTAKSIRNINPTIVIEVSGGITPENIKEYAVFADRISLGCLTHSVSSKDFSLEVC